jgi:hypothetical protein
VLHNAARVPKDSPRYGEAQQVVQDALINIGQLNATANQGDVQQAGQLLSGPLAGIAQTVPGLNLLPPAAQEQALAGAVGFGRGASAGAVKPPSVPGVENPIGQAHPAATAVGDVLGAGTAMAAAAPLVAGLSPAMGGAVLGGGYGAARGAIDPALTGDRAIDATLGGLTGIVGGAVAGKVIGKLAPAVATVGRNIMALISRKAAASGTQAVGSELVDLTEATLRKFLTAKGVPADQIESTIANSRPLWTKMAPQPPLAADFRATPMAAPRPERVAPLPETGGRGFAVTGTRATPTVPTQATLADMTGMSNLQFERAPADVAAPRPVAAKSGRNVADIMREGEKVMGRPLTDAERHAVLERLFGRFNPKPGHPIWFGEGSPTE